MMGPSADASCLRSGSRQLQGFHTGAARLSSESPGLITQECTSPSLICLLINWFSELLDMPLDVWSQQQRQRNKALMSRLEGDLDPLIGQSYGLIYPSSTAAHSPTSCDLAHCHHLLKMSSKPVHNSSSYFLHKQTDRSILITSSVEVIRVHLCRVTGRNKLCTGHQSNTGHTLILRGYLGSQS